MEKEYVNKEALSDELMTQLITWMAENADKKEQKTCLRLIHYANSVVTGFKGIMIDD